MKYKTIGFTALALSVFTVFGIKSALSADKKERYVQHLEESGYTPCENCPDSTLCTHLPIIKIDTYGVEIPGKPYHNSETGLTGHKEIYINEPETVKQYLSELNSVFIALCGHYSGKGRIEAAYFPYIIKKYRLIAFKAYPSIMEMLFGLLDDTSIYCRENAMQAIYTTGNSEYVVKALQKIDKIELFYHGKLISDGLLNFSGSAKVICEGIENAEQAEILKSIGCDMMQGFYFSRVLPLSECEKFFLSANETI